MRRQRPLQLRLKLVVCLQFLQPSSKDSSPVDFFLFILSSVPRQFSCGFQQALSRILVLCSPLEDGRLQLTENIIRFTHGFGSFFHTFLLPPLMALWHREVVWRTFIVERAAGRVIARSRVRDSNILSSITRAPYILQNYAGSPFSLHGAAIHSPTASGMRACGHKSQAGP